MARVNAQHWAFKTFVFGLCLDLLCPQGRVPAAPSLPVPTQCEMEVAPEEDTIPVLSPDTLGTCMGNNSGSVSSCLL